MTKIAFIITTVLFGFLIFNNATPAMSTVLNVPSPWSSTSTIPNKFSEVISELRKSYIEIELERYKKLIE